jgi:hypothetical protein
MILDGVDWVVSRSQHVEIDQDRLLVVAKELDPGRLQLPDWQVPVAPAWRDERLVDFFLLFNSINFCYWGQPKWTISYQGQPSDGAFGLMAALTRALEEGYPLLDGAFLARVGEDEFHHILRGNVPIPLERERWAILRECGPVLVREFGGRWTTWHSLRGGEWPFTNERNSRQVCYTRPLADRVGAPLRISIG